MLDKVVQTINETLDFYGITISQVLKSTLTSRSYDNHPIIKDILLHSTEIFVAVLRHPEGSDMKKHVHETACDLYMRELREITSEAHGWHFGAFRATTKQLEEFCLKDMVQDIKTYAPMLWRLFDWLLGGSDEFPDSASVHDGGGDIVIDSDGQYWDEVDAIDLEGFINGLTAEVSCIRDSHSRHHAAIVLIVSDAPSFQL